MVDLAPPAVASLPEPAAVGGPRWGWDRVRPAPTGRWSRLVARLTARPWVLPLAVTSCVAGALGYVLLSDPVDARPDPVGSCIFRATTGLDCPACGGTRMVWYLLHGDVVAAARHHVVALFAVPLLAYMYLAWVGSRVFGLRLPRWRPSMRFWGVFLAAWGVFMVVRNLPWEPFLYVRV